MRGRRAAVSLAVVAVVAGAAVSTTLRVGSLDPSGRLPPPRSRARAHISPAYSGEPELSQRLGVPRVVRAAAVRFVRDDERWRAGGLAAIPRTDATARVLRLLERAGRLERQLSDRHAAPIGIAAVGARRYVVTSPAGNFLVGQSGRRWVVVSLPGD